MSLVKTAGLGAVLLERVAGALAGDLTRHVHVRGAPAPERNRKRYGDILPDGSITEAAAARDPVQEVVVYIEGAHGGQGNHPEPEIDQRNKSFVPRVLPI